MKDGDIEFSVFNQRAYDPEKGRFRTEKNVHREQVEAEYDATVPRVFIVQERSNLNFTPARPYGDFVFLLPEGEKFYDADKAARQIVTAMRDFNDSDYLLLAGHPSGISIAAATASRVNGGRWKELLWGGGSYYTVQHDLSKLIPRGT